MRAKTASEALIKRHRVTKSWITVSRELNGFNRGILYAVANGKKPSPRLIELLNEKYNLHLPYPVSKVAVPLCSKCGKAHVKIPKRCADAPIKRRQRYDISLKQLRELLNSPYSNS